MTTRTLLAGAIPAAFLASCAIPGMPRVVLAPDTGAGAAAGTNGGAGDAEFKALAKGLKDATDEVKRFAEQSQGEMKRLGTVSDETKAAADKAISTMNERVAAFDKRLDEVEQKSARRPGGEPIELKSIGQHVIENERVKAMLAEGSGFKGAIRVPIEVKNITSAPATVGAGTSPSNSLVTADRQAIVNLPDRPLRVRSLITPGNTASNSIEYPVETGFTNAAAAVPETQTKPQSDLTFDLKNSPVVTLAHVFRGSRQILDDAPALASYIDGRARYGLDFVEDGQLLYGNGSGGNLKGIIPQASAYAATPGIAPGIMTSIDVLRMAILQSTVALFPATGIVLNDVDWASIEMTKDTQGRYIIGDPQGAAAPRLWNLPVVTSFAMAANQFLVGAFRLGAQIFDRQTIEVLISTEDRDNFVTNMITIRAEERLALAVYRPQAFVQGQLRASS